MDMLKIGSNVGIDGKRHARISMEILVNTDWNFTPMHVPALAEAKSRLDDRFSGLEEPKQIFLEILAQIRLTGKLPPYGLLFVGPPGTGKTTFAKAAAHMMSENIIHVDVSTLGTNTEEAAGSSRIYSNSQPGFLLEGMYRNRSSTGVLLVNEFDKARESSSGYSVVNALLSVLDKNGFYDNSLEEVIPTQNLYAIATANDLSAISKPLLDRFCIIRIPGYSKEEKKDIFSRYALPRAMDGIPEENIHVDEAAVDLLISEYSVESGVREIEQFAARIVQNYCLAADGEIRTKKHYGVEDIRRLFGPGKQIVRHFAIHPGQVNAAVSDNGKVRFLLLEAAVVPGSGKFHVIGMGSRQRGYSEAAYWCVRNTVSPSVCDLSKCDVTVFVPQTLPDGYENHVGAATYAAICSRILNRTYALSGSCFIGGCDLNGNLFWDDNDLTAVDRKSVV